MKKFITLIILSIVIGGCSKYTTKKNNLDNYETKKTHSLDRVSKPQKANFETISARKNVLSYVERYDIKKVAVLLPSDEAFRDISVAIRDGIISSWYDNVTPQFRPELLFIATSSPTVELVSKIREEKVDFVIGPLRKGLISKIKSALPEDIGMLALNTDRSLTEDRERFFQFALTPENEAIQVARKAIKTGQRMLLIYPNTDWGARISQTYRETWRELGGIVVSEISFDPNEADHSNSIKKALNIELSIARKNSIRTLLGTKLQFEYRRRDDIEIIVVAANEAQARQILPQLRFHKAENLPIFSSSHVFSDVNIGANKKDLEGLIFGDAPWVTAEEDFFLRKILRDTSHPAVDYPRLFAFGMDAYNILPFLKKMDLSPSLRLPGATGALWVDLDNVIQRDLKWYKFRNGKARRQNTRT